MADLLHIFDHPKRQNPEDPNNLFDWRRPARYKDDVGQINRILKNGARKTPGKRNQSLSNYVSSHMNPMDKRQRVMVKMHYYKTMKSHMKYIKDYMVQASKETVEEKPQLFGTPLDEYEKAMVPLNFKFIISPENQSINHEELAKSFIWKMEQLTGYEFYWMGAVHTDTEHPHAHLVINGKDKHGRSVRFPKDFIKLTMPDIVRNTATVMVGERTQQEMETARKRAVTSLRWTSFDENFKQMGDRIYFQNLGMDHQNRLAYLASIGMAEKGNGYYVMHDDYEFVLKTSGRYNTFFSEFIKPDAPPLVLYAGGKIEGEVETTYSFDRDEAWSESVIIREPNRRVFVPVYQLFKDNLEGKTVRVDVPGGDGRFVQDKDIVVMKKGESGLTAETSMER